jgi:hypothetical protein
VAVNGPAIAVIGAGGVFLWSAIRNEKITDVIKDVLTGKKPPASGPPEFGSSGSNSGGGNAPAAPTSPSGNIALGKAMAAQRGWTGGQWDALYALWNQESGWRTNADNPSSGAYGIPQSLPASKMAAAGSDYLTNPRTQITWGLDYIAGTYGTPEAAWAHEQANNWY